jgi:futalosine hydrolase
LGINSIMAPTICEAELIIGKISDREESVIQGKPFFKGYLNSTAVVLTVCGVGKANAAHASSLLIERFRPGLIYVLGVAGAYPLSGLNIGDIAVAEKEVYGDEGLLTDDGFLTMDAINLPVAAAGCTDYYNEFPMLLPDKLRNHGHRGIFVTVSSCSGTGRRGDSISSRFNAICENMEGAAVAHIGLLNNVAVAEIRGISNIIEDRSGKPLDKSAILRAALNAQRFFLETLLPA